MSKLTFDKNGRLSDICRESGGQTVLCFKEHTRARLSLGEESFEVRGGECLPNISKITDGTYTPVLHYKGKSLELSRIEKRGSEIYEAYPSAMELITLIRKIDRLEADFRDALEKIKQLRDALDGQTVFEI